MPPIITLTTDFGLRDEYVGVVKGILAAQAPQARVIDLCHQVAPQDVRQAAFLLRAAVPYFPAGTIHLAVVDPGVGTERELLILQAQGQCFLAPDNGLLAPFLADDSFQAAFVIDCPHLYQQPVSDTFHGRDILAPVAAALANGNTPAELGRMALKDDLKNLSSPQLQIDLIHGNIAGFVIHIDHFGNLTTNIRQRDLAAFPVWRSGLEIVCRGKRIDGLATTYGSFPEGKLLALLGSRGYLEVAVSRGNAAKLLGAAIGDPIQVLVKRKE
ncbi:SAM hydrolase/SAM-dependent halogenase family protein [Thiovibrio sp. JS02]